jgi:titin
MPALVALSLLLVLTGCGPGDLSGSGMFTTPDAIAGDSITATAPGYTEIAITWQAVTGAVGYKLYWRTDDAEAGIEEVAGTSYTHSGLVAGTLYYYQIAAVNATSMESDRSEEVSKLTRPGQVSGLDASALSETEIELSWGAVNSATGYTISWSGNGTSGTETTASTTWTHSGLTANTSYSYTVQAQNQSGDGPPSAERSAVTTKPVPTKVTGVTVTADGTSVTVRWAKKSNVTSFTIYWSKNEDMTGSDNYPRVPADETSWSLGGFDPGTWYFQVSATNEVGEGPRSDIKLCVVTGVTEEED